jgi:glycosyltransferase involved in cell wall biosynthesis
MSKGEHASSTRYRALQFFEQFIGAGFAPSHRTVAGQASSYVAAIRDAQQADCVVVLRKTFPSFYLWPLRKFSRKLLFDFDDAIFCNTDGSSSITRMSRFANMASVADHVFAGNEFLAGNARQFNTAVTVIPTAIDPDRYPVSNQKPKQFLDLVWIGSSSTRKYLEDAMPWLAQASQRIPNLRLKIIADFDLPDCGVTTLPILWGRDTEADALASSHIGIAPMRDDDWSRGKCALKVIQYMAAGLPVISSAVGANAEVLEDGAYGYLVSSQQDWIDRLVKLAGDSSMRQRMGDAGRLHVISNYSNATAFSLMRNVLERMG